MLITLVIKMSKYYDFKGVLKRAILAIASIPVTLVLIHSFFDNLEFVSEYVGLVVLITACYAAIFIQAMDNT